MTAEFTGAIIVPLKNEYGSVYGWEAICFPSSGRSWLECALAGAIRRAIPDQWESIQFALKLDIRSDWDGWDDRDADVWSQRRTEIAASLEEAIKIAASNEGYN